MAQQALAAGDREGAVALYQQIAAQVPSETISRAALAQIAQDGNDLGMAEDYLRELVAIAPQDAMYFARLAEVCRQRWDNEGCLAAAREAARLGPTNPIMQDVLAAALEQNGQLSAAIECLRQSFTLQATPTAMYNLGTCLVKNAQLDEGIEWLRRSAEQSPDNHQIYNNLGAALVKTGQFAAAADCFRRAIAINPQLYDAQCNLGRALTRLQDFAGAEVELRRATAISPRSFEAYNSLGNLLQIQARFDEAMVCFQTAIACQELPQPHYNRSQLRLLRGDFRNGWSEFEWRWKMPGARRPNLSALPWEGEPLGEKTLLIEHEQGLGDAIQTVRFAAIVKAQCPQARIVFRCPARWHALLRSAPGIDQLIDSETRPDLLHYWVAAFTLPRVLEINEATLPGNVPYLFADSERVAQWRDELQPDGSLKVGIAWQGNRDYPGDAHRSIPLRYFLPLAGLERVSLYSLQKNFGREQLVDLGPDAGIMDLADRLDTAADTFVDTAAAMTNLDLVITSDTAVAHLAGALGVRVWLALQLAPNWRWLLNRDDSPWYPTMRLFRQRELGNWEDVFRRVAERLTQLEADRAQ